MRLIALCSFALFSVACLGVSPGFGDAGTDVGNRDAGTDGPTDAGPDDPTDAGPDDPVTDGGVVSTGGISFGVNRPNVMLVVDRSGSMLGFSDPLCVGASCTNKWQELVGLSSYLGDVKDRSRLGLTLFPAPGAGVCGARDGTVVPMSEAPDADQQVIDALIANPPGGGTPVAVTLDELRYSGTLDDPERDNFIVLLTDGMPSCACGPNDPACEKSAAVMAVEDLVAMNGTLELYVIGFGASIGTAAGDVLATMAQAAGTALPGPGPAWFQANSIEELLAMLQGLTARMQPCDFLLDDAPAGELLVVLDGVELTRCSGACSEGYIYEETRLRVSFRGASCETLRDGQDHEVLFTDIAG